MSIRTAQLSVCPLCAAPLRAPRTISPRLSLARCGGCGHTVAEHATTARAEIDYHEQYDGGLFLEALAQTRMRQGREIIARLRRSAPELGSLVDFGCGRGWFLDCACEAGFARLAGVDRSAVAVSLLRPHKVEGILIGDGDDALHRMPLPSFRTEVLSALDVIEHFPVAQLRIRVQELVALFRPTLMIVKVPVSSGLLYRTATLLARLGASAPLEQLYQVGTHPPHLSYFSQRSLELLLAQCSLEIVERWRDLDFEPAELGRRVHMLRRLRRLATLPAIIAARAAAALGLQDSLIVIARTVATRA
jgi:hypothetical protein